jgi:hypothetical protein
LKHKMEAALGLERRVKDDDPLVEEDAVSEIIS